MVTLKELTHRKDRLTGGHRLCAGCGASIVMRQVMLATEDELVLGNATGCLEVATTIYPYTAWDTSWIHNAFENVAATVSGVETAYRVLKKRGKVKKDKPVKFIAVGGDGGTYDIGLQSLSGGKQQRQKDLTGIIAAHNIPYVAQTAPHRWRDLMTKVQKALSIEGPTFMNIFAPCHRGWRMKEDQALEICRVAADTCFWPLYEIEYGEWKLNYKPKEKKPVTDFLKFQARFKHLFDGKHDELIAQIQEDVDQSWSRLVRLCGEDE
jgi:pyruvate ferredoxin oxidoreductase beta subunit